MENERCQSGVYVPLSVYLAGGLASDWQDIVREACPSLIYLDPRCHGLVDEDQYTLWDLEAIRHCDILFAFFEESNPRGYNLSLEIGFAKALGKRIIYVDEKFAANPQTQHYTSMNRACADVNFTSLDKALEFLKQLAFEQSITND